MGRRIFGSIFNTKPAEFNDLFLTGRMAYAIDLDDDVAESDIPTTVIRSKADLQGIEVIVGLSYLYRNFFKEKKKDDTFVNIGSTTETIDVTRVLDLSFTASGSGLNLASTDSLNSADSVELDPLEAEVIRRSVIGSDAQTVAFSGGASFTLTGNASISQSLLVDQTTQTVLAGSDEDAAPTVTISQLYVTSVYELGQIPEPSSTLLGAVGALALCLRRQRKNA